jgi:hypothetical protein
MYWTLHCPEPGNRKYAAQENEGYSDHLKGFNGNEW